MSIRHNIAKLAAALWLLPQFASAQMMCADRATIMKLTAMHDETLNWIGSNPRGIVEIFTADTGTWTLVFTSPGGRSCVMGSGTIWETVSKPVGVEG